MFLDLAAFPLPLKRRGTDRGCGGGIGNGERLATNHIIPAKAEKEVTPDTQVQRETCGFHGCKKIGTPNFRSDARNFVPRSGRPASSGALDSEETAVPASYIGSCAQVTRKNGNSFAVVSAHETRRHIASCPTLGPREEIYVRCACRLRDAACVLQYLNCNGGTRGLM
ncbi:hypothetical protein MRX96_017947 [Rhipicephalus microplus]